MKITSVDIFDMSSIQGLSGCAPICIRVNTDKGISGFGEVGVAYGRAHNAGVGIAKDFAKFIIGRNPLEIEEIWERIFRDTFWGMGGGTIINAGMSAVDIALWDIKGKAYNMPVWQMLGGKTNKKLRTYASQIQFDWGDVHRNLIQPEEYAEAARKAIFAGFNAVKVDPIGVTDIGVWARDNEDPEWRMRGPLPNHVLDLAVERVKAIREVDKDLDIIIELHSFTDTTSAVQLGQAIKHYRIMYYEEPVHPLNAESMLEIHKSLDIPIASGERIYTRFGFRKFLEKRALQVIQPDLCLCGGITEGKKICDMANIYDAQVQIHVCGGPISTAAALQIESVIPNFLIHELHEYAIKKEMREICQYDYQPVDGYFECTDLPGIGQELTDEAMKKSFMCTIK